MKVKTNKIIHHDKNIVISDKNVLGKEKKENDDVKSDEKKENIKENINEIKHLKEMIERTILSHHNYKVMDILTSNDINISINSI